MFRKKFNIKKGKEKLLVAKISTLVDTMLTNNCEIFISTTNDEVFLLDKKNKISLCLEHSNIKVANHDFLYNETLPLKEIEKQKTKVKEVLNSQYNSLKKELFKNKIDLLDKLINYNNEI